MNLLTKLKWKFDCLKDETIAGGSGAGPGFHGQDAVQTHMTNTRITGNSCKCQFLKRCL